MIFSFEILRPPNICSLKHLNLVQESHDSHFVAGFSFIETVNTRKNTNKIRYYSISTTNYKEQLKKQRFCQKMMTSSKNSGVIKRVVIKSTTARNMV